MNQEKAHGRRAVQEQAIRLFEEGKTYAEIARIQGRDAHNVRKYLVAKGIAEPRRFADNRCRFEVGDPIITKGTPEGLFVYYGGFIDTSHKLLVKCVKCGTVKEVYESATRTAQTNTLKCRECAKREREKNRKPQKAKKIRKPKQLEIEFTICKECGIAFARRRKTDCYCSEPCRKRSRNRSKDHRINANNLIDKDISLQRWCASFTFANSCFPPFDSGKTCSMLGYFGPTTKSPALLIL